MLCGLAVLFLGMCLSLLCAARPEYLRVDHLNIFLVVLEAGKRTRKARAGNAGLLVASSHGEECQEGDRLWNHVAKEHQGEATPTSCMMVCLFGGMYTLLIRSTYQLIWEYVSATWIFLGGGYFHTAKRI